MLCICREAYKEFFDSQKPRVLWIFSNQMLNLDNAISFIEGNLWPKHSLIFKKDFYSFRIRNVSYNGYHGKHWLTIIKHQLYTFLPRATTNNINPSNMHIGNAYRKFIVPVILQSRLFNIHTPVVSRGWLILKTFYFNNIYFNYSKIFIVYSEMLPHITEFMKHISSSVWERVVTRPERFVTLTTIPRMYKCIYMQIKSRKVLCIYVFIYWSTAACARCKTWTVQSALSSPPYTESTDNINKWTYQ